MVTQRAMAFVGIEGRREASQLSMVVEGSDLWSREVGSGHERFDVIDDGIQS